MNVVFVPALLPLCSSLRTSSLSSSTTHTSRFNAHDVSSISRPLLARFNPQRLRFFSSSVFSAVKSSCVFTARNLDSDAGEQKLIFSVLNKPDQKSNRTKAPEPKSTRIKTPVITEPLSISTFAEFGLIDELLYAMDAEGLYRPSAIQAKAIPEIMNGEDILFAAETGSGKTLAYLLPLFHKLKMEEKEGALDRKPNRPRLLILVPSRELAEQVLGVAKGLSHFAKLRCIGLLGAEKWKIQKDALSSRVDVVVAAPGRLLKHKNEGNISFADVKYVVVDEVDTMYDRGFAEDLRNIIGPLHGRKLQVEGDGQPEQKAPAAQFVMVSATIPQTVEELLKEKFPHAKTVMTKNVHLPVPTLRQHFVTCAQNEKRDRLLELLDSVKSERTMVFCNTQDCCRATDYFLNESGYETACYHGAIPPEERSQNFEAFRTGKKNIMVCTDIAARGLDTDHVDHVILFDFPKTKVDYLHRIGRTARAGAKGRVTSLVTKFDQPMMKSIQEGTIQGSDILTSKIIKNPRGHPRLRRPNSSSSSSQTSRSSAGPTGPRRPSASAGSRSTGFRVASKGGAPTRRTSSARPKTGRR